MNHLITLTLIAIAPAISQESPSKREPLLILDQASSDIFPESWRTPRIDAKAELLADSERTRCQEVIGRAMGKYPEGLLEGTLKSIYCLGHLEYSGAVTGGTRSKSAIYVVCKPTYSSEAVERIFHAEYSSVLFHKLAADFDAEAWQRLNSPDFAYLGSGVQAVKSGQASRSFDEALHEQGFLHRYSQASVEEDFNSHAARLMIGDTAYWQAIEKHSKLRAKADLVMNFYAKIHTDFTRARFAELRRSAESKPDASMLTLERIFTDKEFEEEKMETFQWSKLNASYFALEKPAEGKDGKDLVKYDSATGERIVLIFADAFTPAGNKKPLTVSDFTFSVDEKKLLLFTNTKKVWRKNTRGDYWLFDLKTNKLRKLGGDAAASTLMFAKFSADASRVAYGRENNLFVEDLTTQEITQLTHDGGDKLINGTSDWVNEEELGLRDGFRWSPDGTKILYWQFDTSEVKRFSLVNQTDSKDQQFTTFPYPTAGETNSATRLGVVGVGGGEVRWFQIKGDPREHYLPRAEWTPDGKSVIVQQFNRLQNTLKLWLVDPQSGKAKVLLAETDKAWVENKNEMLWIGDDFLWLSERSGWRHAYRVSLDGKVKPITTGKMDVIEVAKIDAANDRLYFLASPQNATQRYLHSISLKDGKRQCLSPVDQAGTHSYSISEDAAWAVHTHSSMQVPSVVQLVSLPDHQTVRVLKSQQALKGKLAKIAMPKTDFFQVDIGNGIMADGWMMSAAGLDVSKKHPLLMHVYGEPAGQTVKDGWGGQRYLWHAMLAQQGYVVVSVDTRGTPSPKGRDWRKAVYRKLGILNSAEEATAVRALLDRYPYLDPHRVGIWGWSGGGSSSLDALFRYPDLYKTAVAVAPVADRALYDSIYEERYMGLPADNAEGYKDGSPITHAKHLKGNLLLIHGTGDDNVHYRGTEMLINELIAHNKAFTIMPYPNRDHSINTGKGISRHLYELMTAYLHQHLRVNSNEPNSKP